MGHLGRCQREAAPLPLLLALRLKAAPRRKRASCRASAKPQEVGPSQSRLFVFLCKNANQSKTSTQQTNKQNTLSWLFARCMQGGLGRQPEGFLCDQRHFLKGDGNGCFMRKWQDLVILTTHQGGPGTTRSAKVITPA